ncbi:MAG TPA: radical SAM family heme chaperone HemW, partial [Syntrophales bacterium]|nr:radical SAM family heme chaperone HemW [Syntrophales bacterium]
MTFYEPIKDGFVKMEAPGLYIHIPFCLSKCHYCGFYSTTSLEPVDDYVRALLGEMDIYREDFNAFDTIYIGGGTPSVIPVKYLAIILEEGAKKFNVASSAEITVEANPADITFSDIEALRSIGINRINLGIQSFDDHVLNFLGRRHNRAQAITALDDVGKAGFDNTGVDLIYGVPGQGITSWTDTLRMALSFNPAHLSCYQLTIEPGTPLAIAQSKGKIVLPDEAFMADLFFKTVNIIEKAGYIQYEVSNFARNLKLTSRHNQKYWNHTPYLGLGPSAHSFRERRRWWNHCSLSGYIKDLEQGKLPVASSETLMDEQLQLESLFLGLRTTKGVHLKDYELRFKHDLLSEKNGMISTLMQKGFIEIRNGWLRPTRIG